MVGNDLLTRGYTLSPGGANFFYATYNQYESEPVYDHVVGESTSGNPVDLVMETSQGRRNVHKKSIISE